MKLILAFVPPGHFHKLLDDLDELRLPGLSASHANGFGQNDREVTDVELSSMMRLEIVCHDEEVDNIISAIYKSGHTGQRGDGKVFVLPVQDALRIQTGERGEKAVGPPRL